MSNTESNMLICCPNINGKCTQFSLTLKRCNYQVAVMCQMCKKSQKLKWRCMDCDLTICEICKEIHSNIPSISGHTIVNLTDIPVSRMEQRVEAEIMKNQCTRHNKKTYKFFCRTCNVLICSECITEVHSKHNHAYISQLLNEQILNEADTSKDYTKVYKDIDRQDSALIDSYCLLMTEFELVHTVRTNLPTINYMALPNDDEAYICSLDRKSIVNLKLNTTGYFTRKRKLSDSKEVDEIVGFHIQPYDITINIKGDLLFISDYCLKLVTKNAQGQTEITNIKDFNPLKPKCVHYEKERDIILLGLSEGDSDFELKESSLRQVVAVNQRRTLCKRFEYTTENKRLFTLPVRITTIKDGGICVIDRVSQTTGRVMSLNWEGNLMWTYEVPPPSLCPGQFYPTDLTITNTEKIIVVDSNNRAFHILNTKGALILHQSSIHLGIERPFCLDTDNSGYLWVGCLRGTTSRETGANLYKIKIKGL
ncbi:TRIM2_3 [Mytilus coruscus]|uniref:TRIM2_3 n=1 Tax=Mytilus coruscus TaxID=42192 RepID=A0A6J8E3M2_MYTCO|nr:TRIM2_3 [Mytilus coruscus]